MESLLKNLKKRDFISVVANRQKKFAAADGSVPAGTDGSRELARALHPKAQYLKVAEVTDRAPDVKSFTLVPDPARGTGSNIAKRKQKSIKEKQDEKAVY